MVYFPGLMLGIRKCPFSVVKAPVISESLLLNSLTVALFNGSSVWFS